MSNIKDVLEERGKRYGAFKDHARIAQSLQTVMRDSNSWETMSYYQRQALTVIADKIGRICNGDPYYTDNWIDIAGYSQLVVEELELNEVHIQNNKK